MVLNYSYKIPLFHYFIHSAIGSQDALEQYYFFHFLVDVGLLFDSLHHLLEILFLAEVFYATKGEMRHEVLSIALIANVIKGCQDGFFEFQKLIGCVLHAEPEHTRGVAGTEDAGAVEVHGETLLILKDFRYRLDDFRLILRWSLANKLQSQMYICRPHPVDELLVGKAFSQIINKRHEAVVFSLNWDC